MTASKKTLKSMTSTVLALALSACLGTAGAATAANSSSPVSNPGGPLPSGNHPALTILAYTHRVRLRRDVGFIIRDPEFASTAGLPQQMWDFSAEFSGGQAASLPPSPDVEKNALTTEDAGRRIRSPGIQDPTIPETTCHRASLPGRLTPASRSSSQG